MIGTAIAALTLTAVRFAVNDGEEIRTEFWLAWAIATGVLLVVSAVVALPLVLLILRQKNLIGAVLFHLLGPPILIVVLIGVTMLFEPGGPEPRAVVLMMFAVATCIAVSSAPFWLYRLNGYRLTFPRDRRTPPVA
jgi:lipopolysaccharide export LptBFGC system permease protein LptF